MPAADRLPKLRYHAGSGQFAVVLSGRWHYLGTESAAARKRYDAEVQRWLARGRAAEAKDDGTPLTVAGLVEQFLGHPDSEYRKAGRPTSEAGVIRCALRDLVAQAGAGPAAGFTADDLAALRIHWAGRGLSRNTVQHYAVRVRHLFRWGVTKGLVPPDVWGRLRAAMPARGRARGVDRPKVVPVPPGHLEAVLGVLPQPYRDMVRLQALTGMRPGEVCILRAGDVDRSGDVWAYRPSRHKTEHHGKDRVVAIGPKAQAILRPRLESASPQAYLFAGREGRPKARNLYRYNVIRACRKAGVPDWTPNQLRHSAATEIRRRFGLDAAQVSLGHSNANVTQVYADVDLDKAKQVAREIG